MRALLHDAYLLKHPDGTEMGVLPGSRLRPFHRNARNIDAPWSIEEEEEVNINILRDGGEYATDEEEYYEELTESEGD